MFDPQGIANLEVNCHDKILDIIKSFHRSSPQSQSANNSMVMHTVAQKFLWNGDTSVLLANDNWHIFPLQRICPIIQIPECLCNEIANNASIINVHARTIGIENSSNANFWSTIQIESWKFLRTCKVVNMKHPLGLKHVQNKPIQSSTPKPCCLW